jgi:hypothetical protein
MLSTINRNWVRGMVTGRVVVIGVDHKQVGLRLRLPVKIGLEDGGCYGVGQNIPLSCRLSLVCDGKWACLTVLWGCSSQSLGGTVV